MDKSWIFDCPSGCEWHLPLSYLNSYGLPHDGVGCPRHLLYCGRRGRIKGKPSAETEFTSKS